MTTIRLIDYDEQLLVVTIGRDGDGRIAHPGVCHEQAVSILQKLVAQLAEHGCTEDQSADEPATPLHAERGRFDADRAVWTDGAGHTWDLAATWGDTAGLRWRWTGQFASNGAPWMRSGDDVDEQPLDVVRMAYGPLTVIAGER